MKNGQGDFNDGRGGGKRRAGQAEQGDQRRGGERAQGHRLERPLCSLRGTRGHRDE